MQRIHTIQVRNDSGDGTSRLYIQLHLAGKSSSDRWAYRDDIGEQLGAVLVGCGVRNEDTHAND